MVRINGQWQEVDWQTAFEFAAAGITRVIADTWCRYNSVHLASPNATLEEFYLLQKIMRGLGSPHIDHRLRQIDFA